MMSSYEDNTRTSNRKVPSSELNDIDGDLPAKVHIEAQDRKIAEVSGRPRTPIKSLTRSVRRQADDPSNLPPRRTGRH
jgi:hypothetical protein